MLSTFEFKKIKTKKLPLSWQTEGSLNELETFLQHNWEQRGIFYADGQVTSRQQFIKFDVKDGISSQNYIGTIIFKGEQLNVFPKVFKSDKADDDTDDLDINELIDNLVLWLGYCDRLNFPFVSMKGELTGSENLMELLITVYVHYVKSAIDRQPYFQYEDIIETGFCVKGKIDFKDYTTRKYPMAMHHQLDYTYSGFVFDNMLNRIIKCTCSMLLGLTSQLTNKKILRNILMKMGDVSMINGMPYDCDTVHLSALHHNYHIILSMSKMFLFNKVSNYSIGGTESFCFLFPAEVLFEGFISGFLREMLTGKAKVTTQASNQYLAELFVDGETMGNAFMLREDILIETKDMIVVVDTKYKEIDCFENIKENKKLDISDADMKQMAVYAAKRGAKKLYLIYPLYKSEMPETIEIRYVIKLDGQQSNISVPLEILRVPFVFDEDINQTKQLLEMILSKIVT